MKHHRSPEDQLKDAQANARFWEKRADAWEKRYHSATAANLILMEEMDKRDERDKEAAKIHDSRWNQ